MTEPTVNNNQMNGYDSDNEIDFVIESNNQLVKEIYKIPYRPTFCSKKRLICYSVVNNTDCTHGDNCTYAHSLDDQKIDTDRLDCYQIILSKDLTNLPSNIIDNIYRSLLFATSVCDLCIKNKCTGGYNCRNGVCYVSMKVCKSNLLSGDCMNIETTKQIPINIIDKITSDSFKLADNYIGCVNGHHLTTRGLIPFCQYTQQQEASRKNYYQSVRQIQFNTINCINSINTASINTLNQDSDSESTTDEEVNSWFAMKSYDSDSECSNDNV